jgi:amino acid transporter
MQRLQRVLGPATAFFVGLGVAIGSGIFRTPGEIAAELGSGGFVLLAWVFGGLFVLASSLVTSELATRFPEAGGEYVFLREAYGRFCAFFFGWGYTVFITGGGVAIIASAFGEAATGLAAIDARHANLIGAAAIAAITAINVLGVRAGAGLQNGLTVVKVAALIGVAAIALALGDAPVDLLEGIHVRPERISAWTAFVAVLPPVLWAYEGTTDAGKLAEEIRDVERDLPRALIGSALTITVLYCAANLAFMRVMPLDAMASSKFVASDAMRSLFGRTGDTVMTALILVVLAGALSSSILSTVRVPFALARDGLAPKVLGTASAKQAPVAALLMNGTIAATFTLHRGFSEILGIYFLAASILFGLAYGSLIVFRVRDRRAGRPFPAGVFRCPAGPLLAVILIAVQVAMAASIVAASFEARRPGEVPDSLYTLLLLASFGGFYVAWERLARRK